MNLSPRRFGLRARLVALVLAPALLVGLFGGGAARRERRNADDLEAVQAEAEVLSDLTSLRSALLQARAPVEIEVRALTLGLDRAAAIKLLDLQGIRTSDLGAVEEVLRSLPVDARPFTTTRLEGLRDDIARGASLAVIAQFDALDAAARVRWEARVGRLRQVVVRSGRSDLSQRVDDLEAATEAGSAGGTLVTRLAGDWFGILAGNPPDVRARQDMAVADHQLDASLAVLRASSDDATAAAARRIEDARRTSAFTTAIDDELAGREPAPFRNGVDVKQIATTFTDSFDLFGPLIDVIDARAADLQATARSLSADASRTALLTAVGVAAIIVVLLGGSLLVAATFERPLSRLIVGLRAVGDGDLQGPTLPTAGPHEVSEASAAYNDVVLNLRLLEAKLDALAATDFGDPWLERTLPGSLGESMQRSVRALADSIVEREDLRAQLAHQASHDALTGLQNRPAALEALAAAMARARRTGANLALAFLDLDGFKAANDTYGHAAGDEVLREVARRLQAEARTGDFCARLGGDEFVVIAENVDGTDGAVVLARRLGAAIAEPVGVGDVQVRVGASIGLALLDERGDDPAALLARADVAAYQAKRLRTGVEVFDEAMRARLR
jgi:diguanylate cyclase (GGDEF)-like protein